MAKEKDKSGTLSPAVSDKYTVQKGIGIGEIMHAGRKYDLRTLTAAEAEELVKAGCTALEEKKTTSSPKP